jgi:hypothetical protein
MNGTVSFGKVATILIFAPLSVADSRSVARWVAVVLSPYLVTHDPQAMTKLLGGADDADAGLQQALQPSFTPRRSCSYLTSWTTSSTQVPSTIHLRLYALSLPLYLYAP